MERRVRAHTDREFEGELQELRNGLLLMAGRVEHMIADSVRSLVERDADLARTTIEADHKVNRAEVQVDELCLRILATRQPVASDLRFITLALKMVTDLERVGDLAVNVCERSIDLTALPPFRIGEGIERMAVIVQTMIRDAIDAFVASDVSKAEGVVAQDDEVDDLYRTIFRDYLARMRQDPQLVERSISVQSVAKFLERMGDHGTNLAEQVIFMVKGKDIRHIGKLGPEED